MFGGPDWIGMMAGPLTSDVIVVGLGAVGAAALYQLARLGVDVIGIDRHVPPHDQGSSHGETRITRLGVGEGVEYGGLVARSHQIWRELEAETGEDLLLACGALIIGPSNGSTPHHGRDDFVGRSRDSALAHRVAHEMLDAAEVTRRYPQLSLAGDDVAYFEPGGGLVYPERCIAAQLGLAARLGARTFLGERVTGIEDDGRLATVSTATGRYQARRVLVCAGAWTPALAGRALRALQVQPQALHWFETDDPAAYAADRFPVFIWMHGATADDMFYGFPIAPGAATPGVKVACERSASIPDPDAFIRTVPAEESDRVWRTHVRGRLARVGPKALKRAACLYTTTPDADFAIGPASEASPVVLVSACSGHGFKHSAGVGELVARASAEDDWAQIPPRFRLDRPGLSGAGETAS